jgi:hypothetical protein
MSARPITDAQIEAMKRKPPTDKQIDYINRMFRRLGKTRLKLLDDFTTLRSMNDARLIIEALRPLYLAEREQERLLDKKRGRRQRKGQNARRGSTSRQINSGKLATRRPFTRSRTRPKTSPVTISYVPGFEPSDEHRAT